MKKPEGYTKGQERDVCLLKRSLYGLKQASRQWNVELSKFLITHGFKKTDSDYSLFTKGKTSDCFIAIVVYVDDLLITGNDASGITAIKQLLHQAFTIKDLGHLRYFLGIEVARSDEGILLNQRKYIIDILKDSKMTEAKPAKFPLPTGLKLSKIDGQILANPEYYRRLIGRLLYLNLTRPDISYSVQQLSQFLSEPRQPHLNAAIHLIRYLKGTLNFGLFYPAQNEFVLTSYCDADWGTCEDTGRSITGYCLLLGRSLVSWKTKKQPTVSKSSAESEYRSMSQTSSEIVWINGLLNELHIQVPKPITLHCDNKSAQDISKNPVFHERTKYIRIDCHYIREQISEGLIHPMHIPTSQQLADVFTKALGERQHHFLISKLGLLDHPP